MPQQGITFGGQFIGIPGAYYQDNVSAVPPPPPVTPPLVFIGYGWGPPPKTASTYTTPSDLLNALRGSPAASFVPFLVNPSPGLNGAQQITFIDASTNTQSNAVLLTSGAAPFLSMTSTLYGPPSNQLTWQWAPGSLMGYRLTLTDNYSGSQLVGDNLTVPFQLAYLGTATGTVSYTVVSGAASGTFTLTSPNSAENFVTPIGSGGYATVAALVNWINGTGYYFAETVSNTYGQLPANLLTANSAVTLPVSGVSGIVFEPVRSFLYEPSFWVNQFAAGLVSGTPGASALDVSGAIPAFAGPTFFSGARGIPPTNSDYAAALNVALTVPGWTVFCDSNTTGVQALLTAHVEIASSAPYGMWRRGFTGSSIGDTVATTQTNAIALGSLQMNYAYPGIYRTNTETNTPQLYGGLYAAAALAGIATGNQIALPLTNKTLNATGIEAANAGAPLSSSQLNALQNSGVQAIYIPRGAVAPTVLSDVTTWQTDNNPENTSSQQVACRYWLAYSMINALQPFVGSIASPVTEVTIVNAVKATLTGLLFTGSSSNGVLVNWTKGSIVLVYNGSSQLASVTFQATLVDQNRYITCTASILPLSFTITATG